MLKAFVRWSWAWRFEPVNLSVVNLEFSLLSSQTNKTWIFDENIRTFWEKYF